MKSPGPMPFLGGSEKHATKLMRLDEQLEYKDISKAERAKRLADFFESDVWNQDVLPIMNDLYDTYLEQVKNKTIDPDALKVLDDLIQRLGGQLQVGIGAMTRIAERRLAAAEKVSRQI